MTTNISELPTDPGVPKENIVLNASNPGFSNTFDTKQDTVPIPLNNSSDNYTSLMKNIEQASKEGMTTLNTPLDTQSSANRMTDNNSTSNYIPDATKSNYIDNYLSPEQINAFQKQQENNNNKYDNIFETIKLPLIVALLFLIFTLPSTKLFLFKQLPFLFNTDMSFTTKGQIIISLLFATLYYCGAKLLDEFTI